jgi:hypothetical protein
MREALYVINIEITKISPRRFHGGQLNESLSFVENLFENNDKLGYGGSIDRD